MPITIKLSIQETRGELFTELFMPIHQPGQTKRERAFMLATAFTIASMIPLRRQHRAWLKLNKGR